jgi:hypothetical protein
MTKTLILSFVALSLSFTAMSQARVGIKGGLNLSNISTDNTGGTNGKKTLPGFNIGVIADFPLLPQILSFQPGLFYTTKGTKNLEIGDRNNPTIANPYSKITTDPSYIEMPLNFVFGIPIGTHSRAFAGIGPYFAIGVAGKNKTEFKTSASTTITTSTKIKWDDDTPFNSGDANQGRDKYKRFDWGGNLMIGAEIHSFIVAAQYGLGMAKVYSGQTNSTDEKGKNRVFSVSVGYLFGGK